VVEGALTAAGVDRLGLRAHRGRTLVLAYHNVVPAGERRCGERSLHLSCEAFAAQLDMLAASHDVVPLSAIDDEPRGARPRAIITFDDAYRGAITVGLAELERRAMPVTIFVAPGLFDTRTWWDRHADSAKGALATDVRDAALEDGRGLAEAVDAAAGRGNAALPEWAAIASEREVMRAATRPGVTLGAHTWSHANLTALDTEEIGTELERPMRWLNARSVVAQPWLAYPYGLMNSTVARVAASAGYAGAFRVDGGWLPAGGSDPAKRFSLPRMNVPGDISPAGFRLQTRGLLTR
jgi:peptidoglycan/xylan/chitin deacetylase (PgdA/CDA1 family)